MRVRVTGKVCHVGRELELGEELDLPEVHCSALIRAGHLEPVKKTRRKKTKSKRDADSDS